MDYPIKCWVSKRGLRSWRCSTPKPSSTWIASRALRYSWELLEGGFDCSLVCPNMEDTPKMCVFLFNLTGKIAGLKGCPIFRFWVHQLRVFVRMFQIESILHVVQKWAGTCTPWLTQNSLDMRCPYKAMELLQDWLQSFFVQIWVCDLAHTQRWTSKKLAPAIWSYLQRVDDGMMPPSPGEPCWLVTKNYLMNFGLW